jgi:hypothetical protein
MLMESAHSRAKRLFRTQTSEVFPLNWLRNGTFSPGFRSSKVTREYSDTDDFLLMSASVHNDGAITVATPIDNKQCRDDRGGVVRSCRIEHFVAAFVSLAEKASLTNGPADYEFIVGFEWDGGDPLVFEMVDDAQDRQTGQIPVLRKPIKLSMIVGLDGGYTGRAVIDMAHDLINWSGLDKLTALAQLPAEVPQCASSQNGGDNG